jgi:hypothetical protein
MHYSSDPGVIPHRLPEVNFLMVKIPTPKPYINLMISWIVFILHRKIFPIHHTCMTCLFFSFLLIYTTRPNDFDLQLGCCISDAFSIFFSFRSWLLFSSPDPKGHVRYCHHLVSVVLPLTFSYFNLLLWNNWAKWNQTWQKASI